MANVKAFAVIGAGYGDEGKGNMVDYFCTRQATEGGKVLNAKVNGGAQAGHTVFHMDEGLIEYDRAVFHSIGAGTFAGADTYFGEKFILDAGLVLKEYKLIKRMARRDFKVYVNPRCRVSFTVDKLLNQIIEESREEKHGTCGLGIFETVHRNHFGYEFRIGEFKEAEDEEAVIMEIHKATKGYIDERVDEIGILPRQAMDEVLDLYDNLWDYAMADFASIMELLDCGCVQLASLDEAITDGSYSSVVFECSQGLELCWGDKRNFPHISASHTGLRNVAIEISGMGKNHILCLEACYVTRTYKTKHGDGEFLEKDEEIEEEYALYDRTNVPNRFQGTLQYGRLDAERMQQLIMDDFDAYSKGFHGFPVTKSLAVTHVDQTSESVLTMGGDIYFKELHAKAFIGGDATYYSFGEKNTDILKVSGW